MVDLYTNYGGNTVVQYMVFLGIVLVAVLAIKIFKIYIIRVLKHVAKRSKNDVDDLAVGIVDALPWYIYAIISIHLVSRMLAIPPIASTIIKLVTIVALGFFTVRAAGRVVDYFVDKEVKKRQKETGVEARSVVVLLGRIVKAVLWLLAILVMLSNMGVQITPLIAGIGVGGIAIAFALQNILEDLFSSFSIYFDKPFEEGDFIIIGADMGIVKYIGLKTTRIQTLQGQELVVSNRELTSSRINNYKKMEKRRIVFSFGVEYSTPVTKLRGIKKIVKEIISKNKLASLDRVHFKEFGNFSLNYEVVYYIDSKEYNVYMDIQERINLELKGRFEKEGIGFAYPTQTLFVKKE
ncbi:MAG: mechanosensitive ion channel family protein [Nanoarchaeota archaeon]|nr:mechanosensitive ion channel family protein [Nanoarchaeota archaeon]